MSQADIKVDISEDDKDNMWKSCCCSTPIDKRSVIYFSRLTMSFLIIFFCIFKLSTNDDSDTYARYMSLLTFIIGLNFPSLKIGSK